MGILFVGAGFASIYPLVVEKIGNRFPYYHPGFYNGIFSLGITGGLLAPWILGYVAQAWAFKRLCSSPAWQHHGVRTGSVHPVGSEVEWFVRSQKGIAGVVRSKKRDGRLTILAAVVNESQVPNRFRLPGKRKKEKTLHRLVDQPSGRAAIASCVSMGSSASFAVQLWGLASRALWERAAYPGEDHRGSCDSWRRAQDHRCVCLRRPLPSRWDADCQSGYLSEAATAPDESVWRIVL